MGEKKLPRVLVVDDDRYVAISLRAVLQAEGYKVMVATSGEEALRSVQEESPDLVVLDVLMPDMDGWEVCRRLRTMAPVPVIMLTGCPPSPEQIDEAGVEAFLLKPVSLEELSAKLRAVLERS